MTKPKPKHIQVIKEIMEDTLKARCFREEVVGPLVSLHFDESVPIPKSMTQVREELETRGFLMFYSYPVIKEKEVLSINISKY